jgi:hypothetical protein
MSMMVKTSIKPVSAGGWTGFKIIRPDGNIVQTLALVVDADGAVRAIRTNRAMPDDQLVEIECDEADERSWIWPLLNGQVEHNVLAALNLSGMEETAIEAFAQSVEKQVQNLPIDHRAVAILAKSGRPQLSSIAFYSGDDERAANRRQQADIYPMFSDLLAARLNLKLTIDRKDGSLAEKLAAALSNDAYTISPAVLKRFSQAERVPDGCDVASIMMFAHSVPMDWLPKGGDDFAAFAHIATAVCETFENPAEYVPTLIKGCGGKWNDLLGKVVKAAYPPPRKPKPEPGAPQLESPANPQAVVDSAHPVHQGGNAIVPAAPEDPNYIPPPPNALAIRYSLRGMQDMVRQFTDNIVIPMAAHRQASNEVFISPDLRHEAEVHAQRVLLTGRTLAEIADISRRFHQEQYRIMEGSPVLQAERKRFIAATNGEGWPGLTSEVQAPNGLWIVPLKTTGQLKDEGANMDHCVGGYTAKAERCSSHIVSIRSLTPDEKTGNLVARPLSTCEIGEISGPSGPFKQRQHYTTKNTTPSPAAQQALGWYLSAMEAGEIPVNWEQIKVFKESGGVKADAIERFCKYDWRDPDLLFEATVPWFPILPKSFRDFDLEGIVDMEGMQAVSETIPPDVLRLRR